MDVKPSFVKQKILDNDSVATHKIKSTAILNKTEDVGQLILKLSKVPMHEFNYDYMKTKYGNKLMLLFTYTDSLVYEIEAKNTYDDFSKNKEMFDLSNYSAESLHYDESDALVVGKIKNGMVDVAIEEFVILKPKMYSILVSNSS